MDNNWLIETFNHIKKNIDEDSLKKIGFKEEYNDTTFWDNLNTDELKKLFILYLFEDIIFKVNLEKYPDILHMIDNLKYSLLNNNNDMRDWNVMYKQTANATAIAHSHAAIADKNNNPDKIELGVIAAITRMLYAIAACPYHDTWATACQAFGADNSNIKQAAITAIIDIISIASRIYATIENNYNLSNNSGIEKSQKEYYQNITIKLFELIDNLQESKK